MHLRTLICCFSLFFALLFVSSCRKDDFTTSGSDKLDFSQDTVLFDTVFTSVGSSTQVFQVYNNSSKSIRVSSIRLASGNASNFRLNIDGVPGKVFTNIEIGPKDSIFVFAEVTIDPNSADSTFIKADSILFETNGNLQKVQLVAWGKNAIFHHAPPGSPPLFYLTCNDIWKKTDLPHVIYGYALVDSACSLTIEAGAKVFLHPGSGIIVLSTGTLKVEGTLQDPVVIQGDRLSPDYKDVAGQWDRIWLSNITPSGVAGPSARNSEIKYAVIKNGNIGLHVDTVPGSGQTTLRMENTVIENMAGNALLLRGSTVKSYNCIFANCGLQTTNILYGGNYDFYHCTFANYWTQDNRQDPSVTLNNYYSYSVRQLNATFGNCIVHGYLDNEIGLDSFPNAAPGMFNFLFDHSLIKVENSFNTSKPQHYNSIIRATGSGNDPRFLDIVNNDYTPDSLSVVVDKGSAAFLLLDPVLQTDIKGAVRPQGPLPDLGAIERR